MIILAVLYRLLLLAYPREFRAQHGEEASRLFAEACVDDWRTRGFGSVLRRAIAAVIEVPRAGLAERGVTWQLSDWRGLGADFRQAARSFRTRPALTLTIMFTLAVGLGTNVAVFSVLDATLLRPLPYQHANRVAFIEATDIAKGRSSDPRPSWARAWTIGARAFERVEWRASRTALVTNAGAATRVLVMDVSNGYLDAIGARPILGRSIDREDARPGAPRVAVLSQRFWQQRLGANRDAIGARVMIDGVTHTIVGVASDIESDIPGLTFSLATALRADDDGAFVKAVAWLRPGTTLDAAQTEATLRPR